MSNSYFEKDSVLLGLFIGALLGIILTALSVNFGTERQTECKEVDGIQVCRNVDYFPWKVKEADDASYGD